VLLPLPLLFSHILSPLLFGLLFYLFILGLYLLFSRFEDNNLERESAYMSFVVNKLRSGFVLVLQLVIKFHIWVSGFLLFSCTVGVLVRVQFLAYYCCCSMKIKLWVHMVETPLKKAIGGHLIFLGFIRFRKDGFMMNFWT
jgi:hypothetical protein